MLHQLFIGLCSLLCVAVPVVVAGAVYLCMRVVDEEHLSNGPSEPDDTGS